MANTEHVHGIGAVMIFAREPAKLAQWYEAHLGIVTKLDESDGNYYRVLERGSGSFRFGIYPGNPTDISIMVNYKVADLNKIKTQLINDGVEIERELESHEERFLYLRDPEGNPIELWETSV